MNMENTTINSFKKIIANCQEVFLKKNQDYLIINNKVMKLHKLVLVSY